MKNTMAFMAVLVLMMALPALADAPERIGVVSALQGSASAKNASGVVRPLAVRQPLYRNDVITTGANSRCVLLFADMTTFCLSANSTLRVQQYIAGRAAQFEMQRGTFQMMSGDIARTNPTQFNMSTPTASIGIRGTTTGHTIGEDGEKHFVLDMEPGHQVIINGRNNDHHIVIDHDLISIELNPQGGFGPSRPLTQEQAQEFSGQFEINNPLAYLPPPLDANGNPILPPLFDENGNPILPPPMYDANGNPIAPMPMYDAAGNPIAPMPMYDANGNPIAPMPMYDAEGNPIAPMPMYDAEGNPIAPPPVYDANGNPIMPDGSGYYMPPMQYDANGNPLPPPDGTYYAGGYMPPVQYDENGNPLPPPDGSYYAGGYMPPVQYDEYGNPLPPPPMYDADGNLISGTEFMYDPMGNYIPPPGVFDPYAADYTGDQIVGQNLYTFAPTHMIGTTLLYNLSGGYLLAPGGIYKTAGVIPNIGAPIFNGPGGTSITTSDAMPAITAVSASTPFTGWTGLEYVYQNPYGFAYLPGTTDQYMGWGYWLTSNPSATFSDGVRTLALAPVFYVEGEKTPDLSLAGLTAQSVIGYYYGGAGGVYMASGSAPASIYGTFSSTIDFGANTVYNTVIDFPSYSLMLNQTANATLSPQGYFNIAAASLTVDMPLGGAGSGAGNITGACFGPNAEGIGGSWSATAAGEAATGIFDGQRYTSALPYYPTHFASTLLLYDATGGAYSTAIGGVYNTGLVPNGAPPTFTGQGGKQIITGEVAGNKAIVGVDAFASPTPYSPWTGAEYLSSSIYGDNYTPGTSDQYMSWGAWGLDNPAALFSDVNYDLAIANAFWLDGRKTPDLSLVDLTAQNVIGYYNGTAAGVYMENGAAPTNIYGSFSSTIDFGANQVSGTLIDFSSNGISLQQSATPVTLSPQGLFNISAMSTGGTTTLPLSGAGGSGNISGACFGQNAEGVGGTWNATGSGEYATGIFEGTR